MLFGALLCDGQLTVTHFLQDQSSRVHSWQINDYVNLQAPKMESVTCTWIKQRTTVSIHFELDYIYVPTNPCPPVSCPPVSFLHIHLSLMQLSSGNLVWKYDPLGSMSEQPTLPFACDYA